MLTPELNELVTRTGPGTPMGEVFRRFWLPALLSQEVSEPDGAPIRLRLLHEDLVAFRDSQGRVGIVDAYCSHRLAPLYFGRNEDCGLRCPYHGWKFDVEGHCVDMPNVPSGHEPRVRQRVAIKSYPAREAGGVVWIYMGPKDRQPAFPHFEFAASPPDQHFAARWIQRSNWLAGLEGEIDTAHISWLHKHFDPETNPIRGGGAELAADGAPEITLHETPYGFRYGARRRFGEQYFWRMTQWMLPMFTLIPRAPGAFNSGGGRAWVPIDDDNVTTFTFAYRTDRAFSDEERGVLASGVAFPPRLEKGTVRLPGGGHPIDTFLPVANRDNDFLLDRDIQRTVNFSGIYGANEQDRALQESMAFAPGSEGIVDRSREHLVASDLAVVAARQRLIVLAQEMSKGEEPQLPSNAAAFAVRAISKICDFEQFDAFLDCYGAEARAPAEVEAALPSETA